MTTSARNRRVTFQTLFPDGHSEFFHNLEEAKASRDRANYFGAILKVIGQRVRPGGPFEPIRVSVIS